MQKRSYAPVRRVRRNTGAVTGTSATAVGAVPMTPQVSAVPAVGLPPVYADIKRVILESPKGEDPVIRVLKNVVSQQTNMTAAEAALAKIMEASSPDMAAGIAKMGNLAAYSVSSPEWRAKNAGFNSLSEQDKNHLAAIYFPSAGLVRVAEPTLEHVRAVIARSAKPTDPRVVALKKIANAVTSVPVMCHNVSIQEKNVPGLSLIAQFAKYAAASPGWRAAASPLTAVQRPQVWNFFPDINPIETARSQEASKAAVAAAVEETLGKSPEQIARAIITTASNVEKIQAQVVRAADPVVKLELEKQKIQELRSLAALTVSAKLIEAAAKNKLAPYDIVSISPIQAQVRIQEVQAQIASLTPQLASVEATVAKMPVGAQRAQAYTHLLALRSRLNSLHSRLQLLLQGKDKAVVGAKRVANKRVPIVLVEGASPEITPELVAALVYYLVSKIPRRAGETRRQFLMRLRVYLKRALARYSVKAAKGEVPTAAVETAATETLAVDTPVIEAEVTAGGEAEDAAAEAMEDIAAASTALMEEATARAGVPVAEEVAVDEFKTADTAPQIQQAVDVIQSAAVPSEEGFAADAAAVDAASQVALQTVTDLVAVHPTSDGSIEEVIGTFTAVPGTELEEPTDYEESEQEIEPWYKNKLLWAGGALAAIFALRS